MKLPRDLSGQELIQLLKKYDYRVTRQTGSHIRLMTEKNGQHYLTIPAHNPLKTGTLSAILTEIAQHLNMTKEELIQALF